MAETELKVILKAKDLAEYTLRVTSNCNRYPKKYRFSLVDKMQNKALEIYEYLYEANRTDLKNFKKERSELQTKAITHYDELLFYIELSMKLNIISMESMEYWSKMVSDIKHMLLLGELKIKRDKIYRLCAVRTVVAPSGNINNNNYNNSNGVRPFCITQTVRVGSKPKSEKDTKKCMTFPDRVNTKEFLQWIKMLYAAMKICIRHIEKPRLAKVLMEVVQNFRP